MYSKDLLVYCCIFFAFLNVEIVPYIWNVCNAVPSTIGNAVYLYSFEKNIRMCLSGMSYIAAVLLMQLGEEEAFWGLTALLDKPKYLAELFDLNLTK